MKKPSLKLKITLWYTLFMLVISAVLLSGAYLFGQKLVDRDITNRLVQTVNISAERMTSFDSFPADGEMPPRPPKLSASDAESTEKGSDAPQFPMEREDRQFSPGFRLYEQGIHLSIYDENGNLLEGQIPFDLEETPSFAESGARSVSQDGHRYFVYDKKIVTENAVLWVRGMAAGAEAGGTFSSMMKIAVPLVVLMILLAGIGGYILLVRAFVPVNKIRKTAEEISESGDLSQRIEIGKGQDEISSLANTFDHMLSRLEDSFEREKQFTSDASHELRTPIAVIQSECEYMEDCAETAEEYKESAASIGRQADKMAKLVSELLTISRMDQNTLKVNFEDVDISELASFVCEEQKDIHPDGADLVTDIEGGVTASADRFLLARLMVNLLSNAYQYTPKDGRITVFLKEEGENIRFSVQDTGIGISEEDLPKIWERFYQADASRHHENGSMGLGLSMVSYIADCHNGNMTAESTPGKGSTFTFTFPKTQA